MSNQYKIGSISKLLGIPIQTLHYYEKCGFVAPFKDADSNYRYYNAWDVNNLLDTKYLRSFEYSNAEIGECLTTDNVAAIQQKFATKAAELTGKISHYQQLLAELQEEQLRLNSIPAHLGQLTQATSPALYFDSYRLKNRYQSNDHDDEFPHIENWLAHMPVAKATFTVPAESLNDQVSTQMEYLWGFSIEQAKAQAVHLRLENSEQIGPMPSVYSIFAANGPRTFQRSFLQQVFIPFKQAGYQLAANPIGRLIVRSHEAEQFTRYFEVWLPITK